ncbi:MAG: Gfo/Idh/MocA family oxidoreductase, partial [Opitutales bacterium]|nr:Gfo/Idh/MocA family oxidoreductase [Opitutales bacterium]
MAAGTGLLMTGPAILNGQATSSVTRDLKVAIIGTGSQGRVLLEACSGIPNIQFVAVCDMWDYSLRYGQGILRKRGFKPNPYEDYQEMLSKESNLDAVIIATPDFMHAEQTNACLRAGINVYCEKMMSNSIDGARSMVQTARETGKLLQVGHQRRSNPRYLHAKHRMLGEANLLGRITHINGQWNRAVGEDLGWPKRHEIKPDQLARFGYENMHQFRNWRWFKQYSGGPISDLGAHQIDIYNWFLGTPPKSIMASGGLDYYK